MINFQEIVNLFEMAVTKTNITKGLGLVLLII
jgi:hypothetical protein